VLKKYLVFIVGILLMPTIPILWHIKRLNLSLSNLNELNRLVTHYTKVCAEREKSELFNTPNKMCSRLVNLEKLNPSHFAVLKELLENHYCTDLFFIQNSTEKIVPEFETTDYLHEEWIKDFFGIMSSYAVIDSEKQLVEGLIQIIAEPDSTKGPTKIKCYSLAGFANPRVWGSGKSQETIQCILKIFFSTTTQNILYARTSPYNGRCAGFLLKSGFTFLEKNEEDGLVFTYSRETFNETFMKAQNHVL
jgi:RimJ/RimL family protein N-acetyltransferase